MSGRTHSIIQEPKQTVRKGKHPVNSIAETVINGFFTVDQRWTVKYWNKDAETLLGVKAADMLNKNIWQEFASILPLDFYAVYQQAFIKDIPLHFREYWPELGAWFDVNTFYCENILSVSFKSSSRRVQTNELLSVHPVQQLRILNELYRFVTEITNDCLWEWNLGLKEIFWIDGGHKRVFGYPIENVLIPQSFWKSRIHPDDRDRVFVKLNAMLSKGAQSTWEEEYRFQKANGEYAFVHDRGHIVYDEAGKALRIIGATQDITHIVLLENKLATEKLANQREITAAVITAHENERSDIGKELHDNLNQVLAVTKLYIQMARRSEKDRDMHLDKSLDFIVNVMQEIRKISKTLVIPGVHIIGLFDNIKNLVKDLSEIDPLQIEFKTGNLKETDLDEQLQLNIFRIVQEQLNNILKHSKAGKASIHLSREGDHVILLITDNGKGHDISEKGKGVGLINIRSRAELYYGSVNIITTPDKGYALMVSMMINKRDNV